MGYQNSQGYSSGEGGAKNGQKYAQVINGLSLSDYSYFFHFT